MISIPDAYEKRMKDLLGEEYPAFLAGFTTGCGQTLRVNRLKTEPAELIRRFILRDKAGEVAPCLHERTSRSQAQQMEVTPADRRAAPVPWCASGFYYEGEDRLSANPAYFAGLYYLQEPSAMAPAEYLPVVPGDRVLDLCAAPGGKSTALAAKLKGEGLLLANDISASRCRALLKNLEIAGVANSIVTCESPGRLAACCGDSFDAVLCDAPCSGEGMFRKNPSMMKQWEPDEPARYAAIQWDILKEAVKMVRPGGFLMYSTCTFAPEEDEQIVYRLLKSFPDYELVRIPGLPEEGEVRPGRPDWLPDGQRGEPEARILTRCVRFWFHRVRGEGQFMALFRKKSGEGREEGTEGTYISGTRRPHRIAGAIPVEFPGKCDLTRIREAMPGSSIQSIKDKVYLVPEALPALAGLRIMRSGLLLGEHKKKRFEPSQALAMALRAGEYANVLSLEAGDNRVDKYLKGETIDLAGGESPDRGYVLVCLEEFPLGWGKYDGSHIKNLYSRSWRKQ